MTLSLRAPNAQIAGHDVTFIDDTGSDLMVINDSDKLLLEKLAGRRLLLLGMAEGRLADGSWNHVLVVSVQVTVYTTSWTKSGTSYNVDANGNRILTPTQMTSWDTIQCAVRPGGGGVDDPPRLNGPWLRHKLYTATAPDGQDLMQVMDDHSGFNRFVPNVDAQLAAQQAALQGFTQVPHPFVPPPPWQ